MRQGILIWVSPFDEPKPERFNEMLAAGQAIKDDLRTLVCSKMTPPPWSPPKATPRIKMPTGSGSAIFDDHCIRAMQQAFCPVSSGGTGSRTVGGGAAGGGGGDGDGNTP